mmetsp:Transcript_24971/g.67888  ORF Transcript_24971/g.67888 Transcript_24971/m.67888 type:complete len:857 (-) Transcript_24971:1128-3698(-)
MLQPKPPGMARPPPPPGGNGAPSPPLLKPQAPPQQPLRPSPPPHAPMRPVAPSPPPLLRPSGAPPPPGGNVNRPQPLQPVRPAPPPPPPSQRPPSPPGLRRPSTAAPPPPPPPPPSAKTPFPRPPALQGAPLPNRPQTSAPPSAAFPQRPSDQQDMTLHRPQPPSLRVLEPLMPPPLNPDAPRRARDLVQEVDEDGDTYKEEDETKGKGKGKKKGKRGKVTAEMKRAARKAREAEREEKAAGQQREREEIFEVGDEGMSLIQLADMIQEDPSDIVRTLFMKGIMLSMNQVLDKNTCKLVAAEYDLLMVDKDTTKDTKSRKDYVSEEDIEHLQPRPPVVTVMGHVDHGKTSLLDYIRKSRVAAREAGGITQGIGAYNTTVEVDGEQRMVCFLDTPGHEAFSAMRARGAQVTDIAVIIVAADDGIRPQTREAVAHAQAAEVPIIVAINKIDKPGADPERVKTELLELNLVPEEWGGNTPMVLVSAKKGEGIADLLQIISWTAEEKALVCNPLNKAQGTVIEAHLDRKVGPVATLLVQAGTVKHGDIISAGGAYGKIRVLKDDLGNNLESAGASVPVQVIGLNLTPMAGEEWSAAANESEARDAAEVVQEKVRMQRMAEMTGGGSMVTLSSLATVDEDTEAMQKLNLIIKGDSMGVVEAIKASLATLPQQSISLRYLLSGSGDITLSDIDLAAASGGLVLGFNLEPNDLVETHAKRLGVRVMTYKVIYDLIDDVKAAMEGKLRTVEEKVPVGTAEVKAVFGSSKSKVAGCVVTQGKLQRAFITVKRGKQVVFDGKMASLRRIKDDVEEVSEGVECGLGAENFTEWKEGDKIECYTMVSKSRRLEEAQASTAVDLSTLGV